MGLGGRKQKQRIPNDPRNLAWADDAAKFGQSYLSKLGWDPSKGLGVAGDGMTSHIKVSQKLDMLGIGAAQQRDPNGIAWKQNKDFENVLRRLNDAAAEQQANSASTSDEEVMAPAADTETHINAEEKSKGEKKKDKDKKRKRKELEDAAPIPDDQTNVQKKKKKRARELESEEQTTQDQVETPAVITEVPAFVPRVKAHRARFVASKNIASKSASHVNEILGISSRPASAPPVTGSSTPFGSLTPIENDDSLTKLTTSTKSVADYFKERLSSKSGSRTPTARPNDDSFDAPPRHGIGSSKQYLSTAAEDEDAHAHKLGMSAFASLRSSAFLASMTLASSFTSSAQGEDSYSPGQREESNQLEQDLAERECKRRRRERKALEAKAEISEGGYPKKKRKDENADNLVNEDAVEDPGQDLSNKEQKEKDMVHLATEIAVENLEAGPPKKKKKRKDKDGADLSTENTTVNIEEPRRKKSKVKHQAE